MSFKDAISGPPNIIQDPPFFSYSPLKLEAFFFPNSFFTLSFPPKQTDQHTRRHLPEAPPLRIRQILSPLKNPYYSSITLSPYYSFLLSKNPTLFFQFKLSKSTKSIIFQQHFLLLLLSKNSALFQFLLNPAKHIPLFACKYTYLRSQLCIVY